MSSVDGSPVHAFKRAVQITVRSHTRGLNAWSDAG